MRVAIAVMVLMAQLPASRGESAETLTAGADDDALTCASCHGDLRVEHGTSTHVELDCTDCHQDAEVEHEVPLRKVECGECHEDAVEQYQWHGTLKYPSEDLPGCADCHGRHNILPSSDRASAVNVSQLPRTCGRCHEDLGLMKRHNIRFIKAVEVFKVSVHARATVNGSTEAASCSDCHSSGTTAHRILNPGHADSAINHFNIPKTCGKCHEQVEKDYWEGIHGQLTQHGETDSPVCTTCHGEHGILPPGDSRSPVSATRVAQATCSPCHESARLNDKYGLPTGRLRTYIDTYHGLKSNAGDVTVANCASCHGAHRILPQSDPTSSIHSDNLQATCGRCHPGISEVVAETPVHGNSGTGTTSIAKLVGRIYIIFIILVVGFMVLHSLLDWLKQFRNIRGGVQVRRMTVFEVVQHALLLVSFLSLIVTGFSLRFSNSWWVQWMFGWEGGFHLRGLMHRFSAVVFCSTVMVHLFWLPMRQGRQFLRDMWPRWRDARQLWQQLLYNLNLREQAPKFERFGYVEKSEYWALVWGTIIMLITGFALWFDNLAVWLFPKGTLDVMLVVHYYEAWLATLSIAVWHLYATIFRPTVYPTNPAWLNGKMPRDLHAHEHAAEAEKHSCQDGDTAHTEADDRP